MKRNATVTLGLATAAVVAVGAVAFTQGDRSDSDPPASVSDASTQPSQKDLRRAEMEKNRRDAINQLAEDVSQQSEQLREDLP